MSDPVLRDLERAVRASPHDISLSKRWRAELERQGLVQGDAPPEVLEAVANPGVRAGDLVLVARRSRPRASFVWLPEMDELKGTVQRVKRVHGAQAIVGRDGLSCLLEGPSLARSPDATVVGRSFGFGSLVRL